MKSLTKRYTIRAPAEKVWGALVDPGLIERWGAGPGVVMSEKPGTPFRFWSGDIHGKNVVVERWSKLALTHENLRDDEASSINEGWDNYYMLPLKELAERSP
jgi:uncharacterized protein YndB with AHSA1/START domain